MTLNLNCKNYPWMGEKVLNWWQAMTCQTLQHYLILRSAQYAEFFWATIFTYRTASCFHFDYLIFSPLIIKFIRNFSIATHMEATIVYSFVYELYTVFICKQHIPNNL